MNFLKNAKFHSVMVPSTGTTTLQSTAVLDMTGYDSVMWIAQFSGNTNSTGGFGGVYYMHSDDTGTGDQVGSTATAAISTSIPAIDNTLYVLDVHKPLKRYVSAMIYKDTANDCDAALMAIQYNSSLGPVTQPSTSAGVINSGVFVSPTT